MILMEMKSMSEVCDLCTCMLVMDLRQAVTSHLEEGIFFTNEALCCVWTWGVSAWFHGCLLILSYPKQVR